MSDPLPPPVQVDVGRQALENSGFDKLSPPIVTDRYEVWVFGNAPVYVHYAGPPWDQTHFDGEAFQNVLKLLRVPTKTN